jgi:hypothetical protein
MFGHKKRRWLMVDGQGPALHCPDFPTDRTL